MDFLAKQDKLKKRRQQELTLPVTSAHDSRGAAVRRVWCHQELTNREMEHPEMASQALVFVPKGATDRGEIGKSVV